MNLKYEPASEPLHMVSAHRPSAFLAGGNADRAREVAVADLRAALAAEVSALLLSSLELGDTKVYEP